MLPNKKLTESDVICDAIGERTFRLSAEWLNEKLPVDYKITHQSVYNWVVAENVPRDEFIRALQMFYPMGDVRHELGKQLTEMRLAKMAKIAKVGRNE